MAKKSTLTLFILLISVAFVNPFKAISQVAEVRYAAHSDVSIPFRDMKPVKDYFWEKWGREVEREIPNQITRFPDADPKWIDGVRQDTYPTNPSKAMLVDPIVNFNGLNNNNNTGGRVTPPDPAGDVGPNHYVQVVNSMLQVFNKSGVSLFGPVTTATIWSGFTGPWTGHNDGDAIVLYDETIDRWLISQFAIECGTAGSYTQYEMIAISTTPDPTGSYYRYAFAYDYMPDYPKLGVWNDGYYMAINRFNSNSGNAWVGAAACVMERSKMITGDPTARMIYFKTETLGGSGAAAGNACASMMPSDCDGTLPASGTPNLFAYITTSSTSQLRLWALHADWDNTANSTFTYETTLAITPYTALGQVPQSGTSNKLDALSDRLMFRNQYRNFGSYETFVTCHSVSSGGTGGIRWYEYRRTGGVLALYQQGTYAPADGKYRWMGSIAMNINGDIGLAYSVSSSSMFPSIYFTGRKASDPLNQLTIPEGIIQTGTVAMTDATRWGDYTAMNIDPSDNQTFWTTQEYMGTFGGWSPWATKISSFRFANTPGITTLEASAIQVNSATLNGTVNPVGLATDYHFEWGTTTSYGNPTTTLSAGSGSSSIAVNAPISGLIAGTTYHFRIVASNSEGTSYGNDLTFTPGAAVVTTTTITAISTTTAVSGGNVTSDGGNAVTERGVCWALTANPVADGNHTTDGSGTGSFISNIAGLTSNTAYHVRAYATNSQGTYYGEDLTMTTLCGAISTFPWNEGFENAGVIPGCWSQEQVASSGINWTFRNGGVNGHPAIAHLGTYNACLNDATIADNKTKLITPRLNLVSLSSPVLKFYHTQAEWLGDQDQLIVYYKSSSSGTWTIIASYAGSITAWTEETISLPNASNDYYIAFEGNAKYGYGVCVDDVSITGTYIPTWAGTVSSDWSTAGNWTSNAVPGAPDNIIIPSLEVTNFPEITAATVQCSNLSILSGATLRINPGASLTVTGTLTNTAGTAGLVVKSDATGTGSLIHATANTPGTIERYITGSSDLNIQKYHLVSVPLTAENASSSDLFSGSYLYGFEESTNNWMPYGSATNTPLDETKGFMVYYPSASRTYQFTGNLNTGDFTPALSGINSPGLDRGWNLIPNPYPSSIDWDLVTNRSNLDGTIYIWPAAGPGNSSNYYSYVNGVSAPPGAMNGEVAVGQSFFVHANAAAPSITFTNASRLHGTKPFLKNDSIIPDVLYLEASAAGSTDYMAVRFAWPATPDFDSEMDAYKLAGGADAPKLSSLTADGKQLSINSLPVSADNVWVPLHFELNTNTEVTFKASGLESFGNEIPIYLEDRLLKKVINLRQQPEYTFTHSTAYSAERFMIRFAGPYSVEQPLAETDGRIFASGGYLFIDIPSMNEMPVTIFVYDAVGRQLSNDKMKLNGITQIPAPSAVGVYIVRIISGNKSFVNKIEVK